MHSYQTKPKVKLLGEDGNVFSIIGKTTSALRKAGLSEEAEEYHRRAFASHSYDHVLQLTMEYVEIE